MLDYLKSLSTAQQVYLGTLALTLSGSAIAYRYMPQVADFVDDNKMAVGALATLSAAPVLAPLMMKAHSMLPQFAQLPAYGAIHMNGIAMSGIAMHNNPLMVRNPLHMGAIHMNGAHAMHGVHAMNGIAIA
jgi:hypothetical protein